MSSSKLVIDDEPSEFVMVVDGVKFSFSIRLKRHHINHQSAADCVRSICASGRLNFEL